MATTNTVVEGLVYKVAVYGRLDNADTVKVLVHIVCRDVELLSYGVGDTRKESCRSAELPAISAQLFERRGALIGVDMSVIADVRDALKKAVSVIGKDTSSMDEDQLAEHYKNVNGVLLSLLDAGC